MVGSGRRSGKGGDRKAGGEGPSKADREALQRAFADVKPLSRESRKRVKPAPDGPQIWPPGPGQAPQQVGDPLVVERESNGIVLGRRRTAHSSIIGALEDPRLETEAECDLHGHTAAEAELEVHRFVRESQRAGKRWVLVIVGKGLHSPGGEGTLKGQIVDALSRRAPARFVLAFRTAPRHLGGTGALVARLVDRV